MAAERAAPERDVLTRTPLEPLCGALDGRLWLYELIELLDRRLERDDGRPECTVRGISGGEWNGMVERRAGSQSNLDDSKHFFAGPFTYRYLLNT